MANEYKGVSSIMAIPFTKDTGSVADTAVDLQYAGGLEADTQSATQGFIMPFDGSVVALSACRTTGSTTKDIICKLNKGVTLVSGATLTFEKATGTSGKTAYVRWMPDLYNFAAGDVVNVELYGTSGGMDPGNVIVIVFMQIGRSGT